VKRAQIGASYRLPLDDRHAVRFYAKADNILNQAYYENGYLTPGATALGGMQYEF
jgi:outer membrane receptor protein involved in Fe transport